MASSKDIKFRVWDNVDYMATFTLDDVVQARTWFASGCPVMNCTGRKDSKGNTIYEDDIIAVPDGFGGCDLYVVEYECEKGAFLLRQSASKEQLPLDNFTQLEVVGNVYEKHKLPI